MASLGQMLMQGPNSGSYTPETLDRRRQMAQAMLKGGSGIQDIRHPLQGLAQMLQAGIGGYQTKQADELEATERQRANSAIAELLSQGGDVDMGALMGATTDPFASDASVRMAQILLGEQLSDQNRADQWAHEGAQMGQQREWTLADQQSAWDREQQMFDKKAGLPTAINDQLVNPGTGEVLGDYRTPAPGPTPTDDQREYAQAVEQGFAGTLQDWLAAKPTGGNVTVNTGDNSGAFKKKADETAATRMSDLVTAGQGASQFMGDIQALAALSSQINTGKGAEILNTLGPYAQALGVEMDGLDEGQAYQAIIDRMAPAMRPAGSGAASDFDARQFLSSLPSLGRTPAGNQIIMQTLSALQQHKIAAAEIASKALNGEITWQEADREIAALGDPFSAFNEYGKQQGNAGGAPGQSTPTDIDEILKGYGL